MNRREVIKNALLTSWAPATGHAVAQTAEPSQLQEGKRSYPSPQRKTDGGRLQNILWVCTDQQRFDTLHGLSNSVIRTPNLQWFMAESVTFTNVFVQTTICSPRAEAFSRRYPYVTQLRANGQRIRATERLVPRILADYDYTCALSGKLHLSPCFSGRVEDRIDDGYQLFWWSHDISDSWPGQNQWYTWMDRQGVKLPKAPRGEIVWGMPIAEKYSQTAFCAEKAIEFMHQQRDFNPWLMSVNIFQPHHPFWPTEEYLTHYDPAKMSDPKYKDGELADKPVFQQTDHKGAYGGTALSFTRTSAEMHRRITAAYYAMIEQVDTEMGRMLDALDETGQADNTIVIFMSDHGEMLGDHGIYLKGPYFYDCLTRVPLIIRWPNRYKAGLKVETLVELLDLAPTLVELLDLAPTLVEAAGIPIPSGMQGRSLRPLLTGETTAHRDSVYTEYLDANALYNPPPMAMCVRTEKYKYSLFSKPHAGELYDLEKDPGEVNNLWNNAPYKDVQEQMQELLIARSLDTTDPLPERTVPW